MTFKIRIYSFITKVNPSNRIDAKSNTFEGMASITDIFLFHFKSEHNQVK